MNIETIATSGAQWLWEQYGKSLSGKALGKARQQWARFRWRDAEAKYRIRLREQNSTTRILGHPQPITIEDIYTDVYVLDKPTAFRRFDLAELQNRPLERQSFHLDFRRKPALLLAMNEKRLYILGKPGAGKTTFLKFLTLQACIGKIPKTPIFVSLKEWADSKLELMPFIVQQFEICEFPDAEAFIVHLLKTGNALVLFDGLDEVNQEGNQRVQMIATLTNFAKRYPNVQICLTCRIAATDYSFDKFSYLEIADFDDNQIHLFASRWYQTDSVRLDRFLAELEKPEHEGLYELARTPLLLALLCLAFDEIGHFPSRRVDLYKDALDALLRKWDASRGVQRDQIYRKLSPGRKEQMLAHLAAQNFEIGMYFFDQNMLAEQITGFLQQLPLTDVGNEIPDGYAVLKAIEVQHGFLIERAHGIYSFSHLTFQEYFTARYIVDNAANGTTSHLIGRHLTDNRWHEVFLLTASLLYEADGFFATFVYAVANLIQDDDGCLTLLNWVSKKSDSSKWPSPAMRAIILFSFLDSFRKHSKVKSGDSRGLELACNHAYYLARDLAYGNVSFALGLEPINLGHRIKQFDFLLNHAADLELARNLGITMDRDEFQQKWKFTEEQFGRIAEYLEANRLMIDCLQLAAVSNRSIIGTRLLLPSKGLSTQNE